MLWINALSPARSENAESGDDPQSLLGGLASRDLAADSGPVSGEFPVRVGLKAGSKT